MNENQNPEFQVIPTLHLTKPLYITPQDESKTHILNFEKFGQINAALYILDACMHWIHTCVTKNA